MARKKVARAHLQKRKVARATSYMKYKSIDGFEFYRGVSSDLHPIAIIDL